MEIGVVVEDFLDGINDANGVAVYVEACSKFGRKSNGRFPIELDAAVVITTASVFPAVLSVFEPKLALLELELITVCPNDISVDSITVVVLDSSDVLLVT